MNCPTCGRFMRVGVRYANEHDDSWEETWTCTVRHPTADQKERSLALADEARTANREREAAEIRSLFEAAAAYREEQQ